MAQDQSHQEVLSNGYCDLQPYNYRVCFVSSRNNIADALFHLTKIPVSQGYIEDEEYVREVTLHVVLVALRTEEIGVKPPHKMKT